METATFNNEIVGISDKLYRLAKSILHDGEAAKDAVQDLHLKLWEKRNELGDVRKLPAFAMRSMRNLCLDLLRKSREEEELSLLSEDKSPNPYQESEQKDMVARVRYFIERLPELQRTIIQMRDVEELEIREIAYITEISENAVSANLSRARQKIKMQLLAEMKKEEKTIWTT
jgi:RNA polymerase sigma-70 factor (ECF subfamily)